MAGGLDGGVANADAGVVIAPFASIVRIVPI